MLTFCLIFMTYITFLSIENINLATSSVNFLSEKSEILCTCAETALSEVCDKAESGEVTLIEILKLKQRKNHVKLLINESYDKDKAETLKQLLEERYEEQVLLIERAQYMGQLCHAVTIPVQGDLSYKLLDPIAIYLIK